jgi:hypothetical protein
MKYATRWCKKCGENEAAPRKQVCEECWLAKQPPVIRGEHAKRRLALIPPHARLAQVARTKWPEGRRWCAGCQTFVRLTDCSGSRCKACTSIAQHMSRLRNEFGIDPPTYLYLFELQEGRCAICRGRPTTARLAVDHDHACCKKPPLCGRCTRGLLCSRCNHELLGAAHDSLQILENAVRYLEKPPFGGGWSLPGPEVEENRRKYGTDTGPSF